MITYYKIGVGVAVALGTAFVAAMSPAGAAVFDFSYVSVDTTNPFSGEGEFITGPRLNSGSVTSVYTVTGVTGFATVGNVGSQITGTSSFASSDNLLYFPSSPTQAFTDINGISFATLSAGNFNIYFNGGGNPLYPGFIGYGRISSSLDPTGSTDGTEIQLNVYETPVPAALPLFAGGFGATMGLSFWRRKRKTVAVSACA